MASFITRQDDLNKSPDTTDNDRHDSRRRARAAVDLRAIGLVETSGFRKIECALVRYWQHMPEGPMHLKLLAYKEIFVPPQSRSLLLGLFKGLETKANLTIQLNDTLGRFFSDVVSCFTQSHGVSSSFIDVIGLHISMEFALASSAIAHAVGTDSRWDKIVAFETGVTIVTNFRSRSQKSSYHTPRLDAFANRHLFQHATKFRVCLDIGDFASLSFIPPGTKKDNLKTIVRNCGPGNMFIDYAMRYITSNRLETDYDGTWGARGNIDFSVVDRFVNRHDYLDKQPSPEIVREMFGNHEAQDLVEECIDLGMTPENIIATVTRITARNFARQYRRILADHFHSDVEVDEAFICGAGAENCNFVEFFAAEFTPTAILTCFNDIGISGKAKQAVSYAYMGLNIALGKSFQSFTVGKEEIFTGDIVYGRRWEEFGNQILKTEGDKLQQDRLHKPLNDCHPPIRSAIPIPELLIDPALLREYGQS